MNKQKELTYRPIHDIGHEQLMKYVERNIVIEIWGRVRIQQRFFKIKLVTNFTSYSDACHFFQFTHSGG